MNDLVNWLRAELDRVEQIAQATTVHQPYDEWDAVGVDRDDDSARSCWEVALIARPARRSPSARSLMEHIAQWDPAAVLRRIAADRQILDQHQPVWADACTTCGTAEEYPVPWPCQTVRLLAEGYGWEDPQ
ncbi:DUF6221 family protein [Kitasatospora aureofaciens]|uniref:DUF6221 family protein n=1 Tax=Kitasatospora aureofaciens TaxID=1894 RepID=UPI0033CDCED9